MAGLFCLTMAVFLPVLKNDFIFFDDADYITSNAWVQRGLSLAGIKWAFASTEFSNWHPITWISHQADCAIYGLRPWGHHLSNVLLHACNTVLVFLVLRGLTGAQWRSFCVAALFGAHPVHVESVAWAAERKDVLSTFFFLLTILAYAGYARASADAGAKRSRAGFYVLALGLFAFGLMSKPMLVTLPFVLLLLDFWPLGRIRLDGTNGSAAKTHLTDAARIALEKLPFFLLAAGSSYVTYLFQNSSGATRLIEYLSPAERAGNAMVSYVRYMGKILVPIDLAMFYPHPGRWPLAVVLASTALLVGVSLFAVWWRGRRPWLTTGWFWFLGTLVPVIGLVQVGRQAMADRYAYIPSIGFLLVVVWGVCEIAGRLPRKEFALGATASLALAWFAWLTPHQVAQWRDAETLFRHALAVTKDNYLAHGNLGVALQRKGRIDEALGHYYEVLRLKPEDVNTRNGLGSLLVEIGRGPEGIAMLEDTLRRAPWFAAARNNLAYALERQGNLEAAAAQYGEAMKLDPRDYRIQVNLAGVFLKLGRVPDAIRALEEAVRLNPRDPALHNDLGSLWFNAGQVEKALPCFQEAARLSQNSPESCYHLGAALARLGRPSEAREALRRALSLRPNYPEAKRQLEALETGTGSTP
jgi:Flp pilus assembly protein TadD